MTKSTLVRITDLMEASKVKFGTSGARGLVTDMTDEVCYCYTIAFIQHLESIGDLKRDGSRIGVAGDLRYSTNRIMRAVTAAIQAMEYQPVNCGKVPSPAVACYGLAEKIPVVMVTGSHIPDDRNGIKFNKVAGEILKSDEAGFKGQTVAINKEIFDRNGMLPPDSSPEPAAVDPGAERVYADRFFRFFPGDFLQGKRVGFYQHSAVGRELLPGILERLGAEVTLLEPSDKFIPVDTEAIRTEDVELARTWARRYGFDSVFSTDGDSDRPLVSDENGNWLRGDVAGILTSEFLGADSVTAPVSCNTALEKCGLFGNIRRTKIGSPYVIEAMIAAAGEGYNAVAGYEANGGYFTNTDIEKDGAVLTALPTRDPLIVFLGVMGLSVEKGKSVSEVLAGLPPRYTASGRLKEFPTGKSKEIIARMNTGDFSKDKRAIETIFGGAFGGVKQLDSTDGLRVTFDNGEIVHLRPSGNAPEFRCYNEADREERAAEMNRICLDVMEGWR